MRSNYIKIKTACLITSVIVIASVRAQQYGGYNNNYARQQYYPQYPQSPKASSTQQYLAFPSVSSAHPVPAARPPVPSQSAFSLNARQNFGLTKQIVQGSEQFTFDMIYAIANAVQNYDLNFVTSPFSVWSLMVLLAEGATDQTLEQLKNVLHLPNDLTQLRTAYNEIQRRLQTNTTAIEVTANHAIFSNITYRIDNKYIDILARAYRVEHVPVNFQNQIVAARTINDYISIRTQNRIENVVRPEDLNDIQLLMASSIFFRGQWKYPFDVRQTVDKPFYRENGEYLAHVPMMTQKNVFRYVTVASLGATFIELPYGDQNRFAMLLIYPNSSLTEIFRQLCQTTTVAKIQDELDRHNNNDDDDDDQDVVELTLPKFNIDSDLELRTVFEHLGITDLFDPQKAKLTKISQQQSTNLHVSRVYHKAIIDVNELGTIAAAVSIAPLSNRIIPKEFVFNHPFAFMITDRVTNTLLFTGQVRHPLMK